MLFDDYIVNVESTFFFLVCCIYEVKGYSGVEDDGFMESVKCWVDNLILYQQAGVLVITSLIDLERLVDL